MVLPIRFHEAVKMFQSIFCVCQRAPAAQGALRRPDKYPISCGQHDATSGDFDRNPACENSAGKDGDIGAGFDQPGAGQHFAVMQDAAAGSRT